MINYKVVPGVGMVVVKSVLFYSETDFISRKHLLDSSDAVSSSKNQVMCDS